MSDERDIYKNPEGYEKNVEAQRARECHGRYVLVDRHTRIFVKEGEDAKAKVKRFIERTRNSK